MLAGDIGDSATSSSSLVDPRRSGVCGGVGDLRSWRKIASGARPSASRSIKATRRGETHLLSEINLTYLLKATVLVGKAQTRLVVSDVSCAGKLAGQAPPLEHLL